MTGDVEKRKTKRDEAEGRNSKVPYPKSVFIIVGNEFCERLSYYGMKAILGIYLHQKLHLTEDKSTVIYHLFAMLCYFTPIFGAMIADQFLGRFKTIIYISMIYVLGHLLKTLAAIPTLGIPPLEFSLIGLLLIAVGTGGIKPCVSAFGGDQFILPQQERQLQTFFAIFYFSINAGSLIGTAVTPILREDVKCFGEDTCYSLAFGVPAILMAVATVLIVAGKPLYRMVPPQGSILSRVLGSIWYGISGKSSSVVPSDHWMDKAKDKYDSQLVEDVKCLLRVLVLYIPLPIFWALYDQTGSRWTFQATRMNGEVGSLGAIKPDQMQVVNPFLILILLPAFEMFIYPMFAKVGLLVKPLQRMAVGATLTAGAFFISGFLELEMMKTYAKIPAHDVSHIHFMNNIPCHVSLQLSNSSGLVHDQSIEALENMVLYDLHPGKYSLDMEVSSTCLPSVINGRTGQTEILLHDETVSAVFLGVDGTGVYPTVLDKHDDPEKDHGANGRVKVVYDVGDFGKSSVLTLNSSSDKVSFNLHPEGVAGSNYSKMETGEYEILMDGISLGKLAVEQGGVYSLVVAKDPETNVHRSLIHILTQPNSVHIFWLLPQYFVITVGEIMFSVTGLEFSYSQAPESMKSVLQAAWLLTTALGNVIVILVAEAKAFDDRASEFFMFACLMLVDIAIFMWLAFRYTPRQPKREEDINMNGVNNNNFKHDGDY